MSAGRPVTLFGAALVAAVLMAAAWWLLHAAPAAAPAQQAAPAGVVAPAAVQPAAAAAPAPAPSAVQRAARGRTENPHGGQVQAVPDYTHPGVLTYPDGSTRPALNGVTADVTILWDNGRPYSPIVEKWTDPNSGWEWYRHADGSNSTVRIVEINGVPQVCPMTTHPDPEVPVDPRPARTPPGGAGSAAGNAGSGGVRRN